MKRINLFFLSLLAGLLVCGNAWGQTVTFKPSTTEPGSGTPEHQYYLHISTGSSGDYFWGAGTKPRNVAKERGTFAFYKVADKTDDYYIYSVTDSKWLSYNKSSSYSKCRGFVQLVDSKPSNYWNITKSTNGASKECYSISPYTSGGSVASIYLNYWQGAAASDNKNVSIGLWTDASSSDDGSGWAIENAIVFSTAENPIWQTWYMRNSGKNGGYAYYDADNDRFPEVHLDEQPTDAKYQFAFIGSLTNGFKVLCSANRYLTNDGSNNAVMKSTTGSDQATVFQINKSTNTENNIPKFTYGSYYFSIDGKTGAVNDISYGGVQGLGFWANGAAYSDVGSQITIEPSMENGERIEVYYINLVGAPDDAVVSYNGKQITNATTFKAIATSTPADDIELEVSVAGYTYETELVGSTFTITFTPSTTYEYTVHVYGSTTGEATYGGNNYANGATITLTDNPIVEANIGATDDGTHKFVRAEVGGAHVNIYYAVTTPTEGKAYYLANLKFNGDFRFYNFDNTAKAFNWGTSVSTDASYIACKSNTKKTVNNTEYDQFYMMTVDGKFLTWRGGADGYQINSVQKGYAEKFNSSQNSLEDWTRLAFVPSGELTGADSKKYQGTVNIYGRRSSSYEANILVKGDGKDKNGGFDQLRGYAQYFSNDYTSAFYLIEATDVKTTEVTFEAYDQTTKVPVSTTATATYGGVTVPWACPYFRAENITSGVTAGEVTGYTSTVDYTSGVKVTYNRQTVTYNVYKDNAESGTPIWTKTYFVAKGESYPDCEKPNNFITWTNFPTGNVGSTSETITLKYETTFKCYKSYNDIETFYSLYIKPKKEDGSVDSDGAYIYNNGSLECKSSGYDKTDLGFFFGFVGDIFTGKVKVYTYDGYYLNSSDPCVLTKDANAFEWTLKNPNGLDITSNTIFALQQNENDVNTFINLQSSQLKRYANDRGGAIKIVDNQNIKNVTITIAASGLSTLCLDYNAILPDNTYAYVASAYANQQVTLSKVDSRNIKAGVGYVIKGERETRPSVTFFQTPKEVEEPVTNYMVGVTEETTIDNSGSDKYVISGGLFCPIKNQTILPANKAYLDLSSFADGNKVKGFSLDDDPTSIYDVDLNVENDKIYNLAGQRVNKLQKGINIVNGQKVYVK